MMRRRGEVCTGHGGTPADAEAVPKTRRAGKSRLGCLTQCADKKVRCVNACQKVRRAREGAVGYQALRCVTYCHCPGATSRVKFRSRAIFLRSGPKRCLRERRHATDELAGAGSKRSNAARTLGKVRRCGKMLAGRRALRYVTQCHKPVANASINFYQLQLFSASAGRAGSDGAAEIAIATDASRAGTGQDSSIKRRNRVSVPGDGSPAPAATAGPPDRPEDLGPAIIGRRHPAHPVGSLASPCPSRPRNATCVSISFAVCR